jgi:hypothetical protein
VSIISGIELTLTGYKTENNGKRARVNASLRADFFEKEGVIVAKFDETIFGRCGLKLQEQCRSVEDGDTADCTRWGRGFFSFRSDCIVIDPVVEGLT